MFRFASVKTSLGSISRPNRSELRALISRGFLETSPRLFIGYKLIETRQLSYHIRKFKLQHELKNQIGDDILETTNIELDDVDITLASNLKPITFNLTWLRDSCHCQECTHEQSRQRLFLPKNFTREQFRVNNISHRINHEPVFGPSIAGVDGLGSIEVEWADGHISSYSVNWLREIDSLYQTSVIEPIMIKLNTKFLFPRDDFYSERDSKMRMQELWDVEEIISKLEPISYNDLVDGFEFSQTSTFINANQIDRMSPPRRAAIASLTRQLVTYGIAKIVDTPLERNQVLNITKSLAYERPTGYGQVFDVVVEPSEERNLAYSTLEFDLHSDLTYREMSPGVQLLHCIRNSSQGGLSYFSDSFRAATELSCENPALFSILTFWPVTFVVRDPYRNVKFRHHKPMITLNSQAKLKEIYYSPFMLPPTGSPQDVKLFYLAQDRLTRLMHSDRLKWITKMDPGDLFMFHNRRVLHGRSSYDANTSSRFLQGCYMDWDEIDVLFEKMKS